MERFYKELMSEMTELILGRKSARTLQVACIVTNKDNQPKIQETLDKYAEFCLENDSHSKRFDHLCWLMSLLPGNSVHHITIVSPCVELVKLDALFNGK